MNKHTRYWNNMGYEVSGEEEYNARVEKVKRDKATLKGIIASYGDTPFRDGRQYLLKLVKEVLKELEDENAKV